MTAAASGNPHGRHDGQTGGGQAGSGQIGSGQIGGRHGGGAVSQAVLEAAIGWCIRLCHNEPDAAARAGFEAWRASHPQHALAWQRLQEMDARLPALRENLPGRQAAQVLRETVAAARRRHGRRAFVGAGLAAGAALLWSARDAAPFVRLCSDESTGPGERRELDLPDASRLVLNTDTAVALDFGSRARRIDLLRGEIYVEAAAGAAGPLAVRSRDGAVAAPAGRFLLRLMRDHTLLTVFDGSLALLPDGRQEAGSPRRAEAGESYRLAARMAPQRLDASAHGLVDPRSWVDGVLSVRDMPLRDFLAELGRYHGDFSYGAGLEDLRVSGTFQIDDTHGTLRLLAETLPVRFRTERHWWRETTRVSRRQA